MRIDPALQSLAAWTERKGLKMDGITAPAPAGRVRYRKRVTALLVALAAALGLVAFNATAASADEQGFIFNEGRITLGDLKGLEVIDPSDEAATLSGELDEAGNFTAQASGFRFPPKTIEDVDTGTGVMADIVAQFTAGGPIQGTFDRTTGELNLTQFPLNANFDVRAFGASLANCDLAGVPLLLSSSTDLEGDGETFFGAPFMPEGAAAATWEALPPVTGGGLCDMAADLLGGAGGLWLGGESTTDPLPVVQTPQKAPAITRAPDPTTASTTASFAFERADDESEPVTGFECRLDQGAWTDCSAKTVSYTGLSAGAHTFAVRATNSSGAGPEATRNWTITGAAPDPDPDPDPDPKPPVTRAVFSKAQVTPRNRVVRRGRAAVITVRVRNRGNAIARGARVCVRAPARLVAVRRCLNIGAIRPRQTVVRKFRVRVKPRARGRAVLNFVVAARGVKASTGRAVIRIR